MPVIKGHGARGRHRLESWGDNGIGMLEAPTSDTIIFTRPTPESSVMAMVQTRNTASI